MTAPLEALRDADGHDPSVSPLLDPLLIDLGDLRLGDLDTLPPRVLGAALRRVAEAAVHDTDPPVAAFNSAC